MSGDREAQQVLAAAQEAAQQIHGLGAGGNKPTSLPASASDPGAAGLALCCVSMLWFVNFGFNKLDHCTASYE